MDSAKSWINPRWTRSEPCSWPLQLIIVWFQQNLFLNRIPGAVVSGNTVFLRHKNALASCPLPQRNVQWTFCNSNIYNRPIHYLINTQCFNKTVNACNYKQYPIDPFPNSNKRQSLELQIISPWYSLQTLRVKEVSQHTDMQIMTNGQFWAI